MSFNISKQDFQQMLDFSDDRKVRFLYIITHHNADGSFHLGYSGQKTASSLSIANKYYGGSTNSFFKKETIKKNLSEYKFHVVGYCKNKEELCASEPALNKYLKDFYKDQWANKSLGVGKSTIEGYIYLIKNDELKMVKKEELDTYLSQGWLRGNNVKGLIGILKLDVQKFVKKEELDTYLREGWTQGVLRNVKDSIWINKEGIKKRVKKEELDTYLSQGWIKGCHIGI